MSSDKIWENIANKISGETDEADEIAFQEWLDSNPENIKIYNRLLQIWHFNPKSFDDHSSIYRKYLQKKKQLENQKPLAKLVYYVLRISAILFFLVSTIYFLKSINLSPDTEMVFQEISVPKGSRSNFNLPDGTKVWLSNNSSIKYPSEFTGDTRELEITGEAYFDVTHNSKKPFMVKMGENRIKVLGTKFSVTAYPEDNLVRADLVEGKIQFEIKNNKGGFNSYLLKPSYSLVLDKTSGIIYESKVPDGFYDYWQKGIYEFRNETLEDLAIKIDRIYNTQIVFEDDRLKSKRFSGTISINDNIFTFIEAVKTTSTEPIQYHFENNKLYINFMK